jgi:CysZ protein
VIDLLSGLPLPVWLMAWVALLAAGVIVALALVGAAIQAADAGVRGAARLTERLAAAMADMAVCGAGRLSTTALAPLARLRAALERAAAAARVERELRAIWKREFPEFKTFAEFKAVYESGRLGGNGGSRPEPVADAFGEACRTLGLPDNGGFSEEELKKQFRKLMAALHPDKGGSAALTKQVTAARDTICARRGWTK